ncbi:hypothetical protein [Streptomyces sp. NPDC094144]|uniref:hypothetical protein n=1 Tax=Streptomyces sp. NPDC094144 TaxID=3366056 RepID=UPI00380DB6AC
MFDVRVEAPGRYSFWRKPLEDAPEHKYGEARDSASGHGMMVTVEGFDVIPTGVPNMEAAAFWLAGWYSGHSHEAVQARVAEILPTLQVEHGAGPVEIVIPDIPTLSHEDWRRTVRANERAGDLIGAEEAAYVSCTINPRGPGLGEGDRFDEVTIAEDEWSHGRTVGDVLTWCGRVPIGLLPKPTGVYCPHCYGHNGMN